MLKFVSYVCIYVMYNVYFPISVFVLLTVVDVQVEHSVDTACLAQIWRLAGAAP
jgi:hypothetical protein